MAGRPHAHAAPQIENSLVPDEGWHCSHLYYNFDRAFLTSFDPEEIQAGCDEFRSILDPEGEQATERLQVSVVSGQKADFGLMVMDPDPLKVDSVHQALMSSTLGPSLVPTYSFVSMTEVSEYVPSVEQYGEKLLAEGETKETPTFEAKLKAYTERLPVMNRQRLTPTFTDYPATCFYLMNKKRKVGENWFTLSSKERNELMSEHARSGMKFMGKVTQLITVGLGVEDWEWGVTLWAKNPQYLKEIVYAMRFDEASARYAEFGPFYTSYVVTPEEMLKHCRVQG